MIIIRTYRNSIFDYFSIDPIPLFYDTVKIMAQKSHFFNFKYLSADDDDSTGFGRNSEVYKRNIKTISVDTFIKFVNYLIN